MIAIAQHNGSYWFGFGLTVIGIFMSALGILLMRLKLHRPGILGTVTKKGRQLARSIWVRLRHKKPVTVALSGTAHVGVTVGIAELVATPTGRPIEEQVSWLLEQTGELRGRMNVLRRDLATETDERKRDDASESERRQADIGVVRGEASGFAGDLLWVSAIGVVLLLAGQFVTAFWG